MTHHNRVTEVLMSKHDYEFLQLKSLATRAQWSHELSAESLTARAEASVDRKRSFSTLLGALDV